MCPKKRRRLTIVAAKSRRIAVFFIYATPLSPPSPLPTRQFGLWAAKAFIPLLINIVLHSNLAHVGVESLHHNAVIGEPRVDCGVETISVVIRTEQSFHGRLYVEEESERHECIHNYHAGGGPLTNGYDAHTAEFVIKFGDCNMRRQRVLNPRGVSYGFMLVVSFHPVFLTAIDRAFNIKCFFMEAVKAIDVALDVSPLTPSLVVNEFTLPRCSYNLKQGYDGPYVKFANIGDAVTHVWSCDPVAGWIYGILVHTCYVDDGHGNRFDLIDDRGCSLDKWLLEEVHYDEHGFGAYADTHVFRFANRIQLYFTCTLQLCFKEDGGCAGITPPRCDGHTGGGGGGSPPGFGGGEPYGGGLARGTKQLTSPHPVPPARRGFSSRPPLVAGPTPATKGLFRKLLRFGPPGDIAGSTTNGSEALAESPATGGSEGDYYGGGGPPGRSSLPPFPFPPFKDSPLGLSSNETERLIGEEWSVLVGNKTDSSFFFTGSTTTLDFVRSTSSNNDTAAATFEPSLINGSSPLLFNINASDAAAVAAALKKSRREILGRAAGRPLEADLSAALTVMPTLWNKSMSEVEEIDIVASGNKPTADRMAGLRNSSHASLRPVSSSLASLALTALILSAILLAIFVLVVAAIMLRKRRIRSAQRCADDADRRGMRTRL